MEKRSLAKVGELEAIRKLCRLLPTDRSVIVGAGDDCAVIALDGLCRSPKGGRSDRPTYDLLLTSDPVVESVHFRCEAPAEAIGHKALARALSDIAAMGGRPLWALIDLCAPPKTSMARLESLYAGMTALANRHGVAIVGGDLSEGPVLEIHVFCAGAAQKGKAILRSGARPGDRLFVTGSLGGSGMGRHLEFEPRLEEGQWLSKGGWASAMIDLSDGLATDLRRINEASGTGAELIMEAIPISPEASGAGDDEEALRRALSEGEDFELLFTVPQRKAASFMTAWRKKFNLPCACIGIMTSKRGTVECVDSKKKKKNLKAYGYSHFERSPNRMKR